MAEPAERRSRAPWVVRIVWLVLPVALGPALGAALDPRSAPVRTVGSVVAWAAWAVALVAALVPRSTSLTVARLVAPAAALAALWAGVQDGPSGRAAAAGLAWSVAAAAAVLAPATADAFVDGSSYGPERRFCLRVPGRLLLAVPVVWAATVAGALAGPLLLAARQWAVGGVALVAGGALAAIGARALHGLSRRWVVFVPAGMVLHDPFGLAENLLLPRRMITALGPAPAGTAALDLTQGAPGLELEVDLVEPIAVTTVTGRRDAATTQAAALLFAPARPGALLAEAAGRRLPVGAVRAEPDQAGDAPLGAGGGGAAEATPPPATSSPS
ncbi:MAG: hypothetical protein HYX34_06325 [Actinobacteria bacterium]|nr:hypothetical protein [Actinomycetota bacterium]